MSDIRLDDCTRCGEATYDYQCNERWIMCSVCGLELTAVHKNLTDQDVMAAWGTIPAQGKLCGYRIVRPRLVRRFCYNCGIEGESPSNDPLGDWGWHRNCPNWDAGFRD